MKYSMSERHMHGLCNSKNVTRNSLPLLEEEDYSTVDLTASTQEKLTVLILANLMEGLFSEGAG